ncbi:hypothetical protein AUC31_13075 [Planococcus rifietoensis]|uniref:Uncharacterized protein n=1 Tax=Planococcus rifietoensis TaxID=200991 RepID=A0A0U2QAG6_9BACL|nr:hypothetical protein [Planococcus rifietoensis]ALS76070.1 hypothetical protein AUC31_13075 [Planococcus rifietoensis]
MGTDHNQREEPENHEIPDKEDKKFNAGGNSSDYDGGQPQDSIPGSEGRVGETKESAQKELQKKEFNAGGNDSDYDGGHPKDAKENSEGRIGGDK